MGVFVITALLLRRERRQLFQFLGISRSQPSLRVLVSRLDVMRGGSRGADGPLEVGFTGPALIHLEYLGAQAITRLVEDPILEALPNPVRRALGRRSAYLDDVRTRIEVSPAETGVAALMERGSDAVVLLGSDVYSHLVRRLYDAPESFVHFVGEESGQPFRSALDGEEEPTFAVRLDERWYPVPARSVARELGTVQRITLP